ncbi:hypothetical protein [Jezberella montanilacus]|uniref:hypothetical protein n=1 Tax=Jezberella montanilacus TaxID=323426 RepID=UPI000D0842A6|nr:hypothetical protein [Jezberella montanilacus]
MSIHHSAVLTIVTSSEEVIRLHKFSICNQTPKIREYECNWTRQKGDVLRHDHVVRKWDERQIEGWPNRTSIEFNVPQSHKNKKLGLVAFVQSQDGREIFQVIDLPLHDGS